MAKLPLAKTFNKPIKRVPKKRLVTVESKLRAALVPGAVCILLNAGKANGSRVVYLKNLDKGRILVSGPKGLNGVGFMVVDHREVIATKTIISGVDKLNVSVFTAKNVNETTQKDQDTVNADLEKLAKSTPLMSEYLSAKFVVTSNTKPHEMIF